jgi:hypothetical protein
VISPVMEQQVANCIKRFRQSDLVEKEAAIRDFQAMKLGRFAEVAIRLVAARTKDDQCYSDGAALIQAAAKASAGDSQPARRLAAKGG